MGYLTVTFWYYWEILMQECVFNPHDDLWRGVVGKYGIEERNCPDEDFLQLCKHNQLTAMNTCFQKKLIHYAGTWMHPATKLHHMIDFI